MPRQDWKRPKEFSASENRRRIGVVVSYDGRTFCGWQSQNGGNSVQDCILQAVKRLTQQDNIQVCGSGRTDSGVHAFGQVAHIEIDNCTIPADAFYKGLNAFLPKEVRVRKAWEAGKDFHARYSAMAREYRYFCKESTECNCFDKGLVTYIKRFPEIDLLNAYAKQVKGTHDFTTFTGSQDICPSKVRDIYESEFSFTTSPFGERILVYKICGNAFLYHMVRSLTGTMLQMASDGKTAQEFAEVLNSKDRLRCGKTAASDGLYLWRISYDPEEYRWFEEQNGQ